jgi:hypothetical protein
VENRFDESSRRWDGQKMSFCTASSWNQCRLPLEFMDGSGYTTMIELAGPLARRCGSALDHSRKLSMNSLGETEVLTLQMPTFFPEPAILRDNDDKNISKHF